MSLIEIENRNKLVFEICRVLRRSLYALENVAFMTGAVVRKCGIRQKKYEALRRLKNTHQGERCFILATGPSLTVEDVLKLQGEFTFGMNSVCLLYDQIEWRPSFYGLQDASVYKKVGDVLLKEPENVFVSNTVARICKSARHFQQFPLNGDYLRYRYRYTGELGVKFSTDAYSVVYDAYSITFSLIQIAAYMGFNEIYLLGCDCNQKIGQKNHFLETGHIPSDRDLLSSADRNIFSHKMANKFFENKNVKIYNATRGGCLEAYERVNLDDVIQ